MDIKKAEQKWVVAAAKLQDAVKKKFPIGCKVRVELHSGPVIDAEVVGYCWNLRYPLEVVVKNTKTGKTRAISAKRFLADRADSVDGEEAS